MGDKAKELKFATDKLGSTVGSGECFDLADQALTAAGFKSAAAYGKITPTANYKWGTWKNQGSAASGDVIQFLNYRYAKTVKVVTEKDTGKGIQIDEQETYEEQSRPHHTAIVESVATDEEGKTFGAAVVLEQNVENVKSVVRNTLYFKSGKLETTKTVKNTDPKKKDTVIKTTTTVTVTGTASFYAPAS